MKNKHLIAIFIIGSLIVVIGALFKIFHFELGVIDGNVLLTIGLLYQAFAGVVVLIKLFSNKNK